MEEGLVTSYSKRLTDEVNPGQFLTRYYLDMHQLPSSAFSSLIGGISKLVRLYGRYLVFGAITTTTEITDINHESVYRLLLYLCKKQLQLDTKEIINLDSTVKALQKRIKKVKISDIGSPFDD